MARNAGVKVDATRVKTDTIFEGIERAGLVPVGKDEKAPFVWIEGILHRDTAMKYDPGQIILKIPAMDVMCYKSTLFTALNHIRKYYPSQLNIYPPTFNLPADFLEFKRMHMQLTWKEESAPTWVLKPKNDCCGHGIQLVQSLNEVADLKEEYVAQHYVTPYLIDGRKFDFRIYIFIANLSPLTIFIYKDGVARFCSQKFQMPNKTNRYQKFVHLTNTAVNVQNGNVDPSLFTQRVSTVLERIERERHCSRQVWNKIVDCARTVIIAILPKIYALLPTAKTFERKAKTPFLSTKSFLHGVHTDENENQEECEDVSDQDESEDVLESKKQHMSTTLTTFKQTVPQIASSSVVSSLTRIIPQHTFAESPFPETSATENTKKGVSASQKLLPTTNSLLGSATSTQKPQNSQTTTTNEAGSAKQIYKPDSFFYMEPPKTASSQNSQQANEKASENKEKEAAEQEKSHLQPRPIRSRYAHILGIDIILDSKLNPQVLELNDRPSMHVTVDFERELKVGLISEAFEHISPNGDIYGNSPKSGWSLIYPMDPSEPTAPVLNEIYEKAKKATAFGEIKPPLNDHAYVTKPKKTKKKKPRRKLTF